MDNEHPDFLKVAQMLVKIKDEELYRPEYKTFKEYCTERWQLTPDRVNRYISVAKSYLERSN